MQAIRKPVNNVSPTLGLYSLLLLPQSQHFMPLNGKHPPREGKVSVVPQGSSPLGYQNITSLHLECFPVNSRVSAVAAL